MAELMDRQKFHAWCCDNLVPPELQDMCWEAWTHAGKLAPVGYANERMLSILDQGMVACTHLSPTKTQFQQVVLYAEEK